MSHPNYPNPYYPGYIQPGQPVGYAATPYVQPGQYPPMNQNPQLVYPPMNYAPGYASAYPPVQPLNVYPSQGNWPNNAPLHYPQMPNYPQPAYPPPNYYPSNYPVYGQTPPQGNYNQGYHQYPPGPVMYSSQPYTQYVTNPNVAYQGGYANFPAGQAEIIAVRPIDPLRNESDNVKVNKESAEVGNIVTSELKSEEIKEDLVEKRGEEGGIFQGKDEAIEEQNKDSQLVIGELNNFEENKEECSKIESDSLGYSNLEETNYLEYKIEESPELKLEGKSIDVKNPNETSEILLDEKPTLDPYESLILESNNSNPEEKDLGVQPSSILTEIVVPSEQSVDESLTIEKDLESLKISSPIEEVKEDLTPPSAPIINSPEQVIEVINTHKLEEKSSE